MNKHVIMCQTLLILIIQCLSYSSEFKVPVGFSYMDKFNDIIDLYEDNYEAEGGDMYTLRGIPIGLTVQPQLQFNPNLSIEIDLGPTMLIYGCTDFFCLPMSLNGRWTLFPDTNMSPYVKVGLSYPIANGDYVLNTNTGARYTVGVEFLKSDTISILTEIAWDTSEIEFSDLKSGPTQTRSMKPVETSISFLFLFK